MFVPGNFDDDPIFAPAGEYIDMGIPLPVELGEQEKPAETPEEYQARVWAAIVQASA